MKWIFDRWTQLSIALHLAVFGPVAMLTVLSPKASKPPQVVSVQAVEKPLEIKPETQPKPPQAVQLKRPDPLQQKPVEPPAKPVFGLTRDTLRDDSGASNVQIKKGNTIAKEVDQIQTDNDRSLPVPTDEYLVTSMPRLKKEVRAEYPPTARKERIEGPVVMDVLIDQSGKVVKVDVVSGLGFGLDEAAVQAMLQFEFEPARVQNEKVSVRIRYTYRFELRG